MKNTIFVLSILLSTYAFADKLANVDQTKCKPTHRHRVFKHRPRPTGKPSVQEPKQLAPYLEPELDACKADLDTANKKLKVYNKEVDVLIGVITDSANRAAKHKATQTQQTTTSAEDNNPFLVMGVHLAVGLGLDPQVSFLYGLRARVPVSHVGVEVFSAGGYGYGAQFMVYTFENKTLLHHIDLGGMNTGDFLLSTSDVPRSWDMTVGTGLEFKVNSHVSLSLDLRTSIPNAQYMIDHNKHVYGTDGTQVTGQDGRYLDIKHVLGNSLTETQFLYGLVIHN